MRIEILYKDNILKNFLKFRDELNLDVELLDDYRLLIKGIKRIYNNTLGETIKVDIGKDECISIELADVDCFFVKLDRDEC